MNDIHYTGNCPFCGHLVTKETFEKSRDTLKDNLDAVAKDASRWQLIRSLGLLKFAPGEEGLKGLEADAAIDVVIERLKQNAQHLTK